MTTKFPTIGWRTIALLCVGAALAACDHSASQVGATTPTAKSAGTVAASSSEDANRPILKVNNRELSREEFEAAFARTLPSGHAVTPEERADLKRAFLVQMIDRKLTLGEAQKLNLAVSAEEIERTLTEHQADYPEGQFEKALQERNLTLAQWKIELGEKLLMEKVLRRSVYEHVEPTEDDLQAFYEEHRADYDRPAQVRSRQIVVSEEEEGQRVLGLLRQGDEFAKVAKKYSLSPDAEQGGDLGYFAEGEMPPEFDQVVFKLQVGRLSDLIKTEYGYHIFLVEDKREARKLSFSEVRDEILRQLKAEKEEAAYHLWLQNLRSDAKIEVNWDQL